MDRKNDRSQGRGEALKATTIVDLLNWRGQRQADLPAYIFLAEGEREEAKLTYGDLDRRVRSVAGWLQAMKMTRERALLVYPPGLDFVVAFFGCLSAGVIPVPVSPINPAHTERGLPQFEAIVRDAQPVLALTTSQSLSKVDQWLSKTSIASVMSWQTLDQISEDQSPEWRRPELDAQTLAYLQYTSGSTAAAKGVMVSHGNVIDHSRDIAQFLEHTNESCTVSWLPHFHDMGLVYGIIQPLYGGLPGVLMSPVSFIQRPIRWLKLISDYRATCSGGPDFAYRLCASRATPEQREGLDLSSWQVAFNGAEPVRRETMERFAQVFQPAGFDLEVFYPTYGLAEATLMATIRRRRERLVWLAVNRDALEQNQVVEASRDDPRSVTIAGCGSPRPGTKIKIVNADTLTECVSGEVGEIWVSGPGVAQGYWNLPEETERAFNAFVKGQSEGPFMRTGDLGFIHDGEVFISGRLKDLVIIAGRNHYPQDIEIIVEESHPALRPGGCVAFSVEIDNEERLVVVAELNPRFRADGARRKRKTPDGAPSRETQECRSSESEMVGESNVIDPGGMAEVIKLIRQAVSDRHGVGVYKVMLLRAGGISKTSSGKTQRRACRDRFLSGSLSAWEIEAAHAIKR